MLTYQIIRQNEDDVRRPFSIRWLTYTDVDDRNDGDEHDVQQQQIHSNRGWLQESRLHCYLYCFCCLLLAVNCNMERGGNGENGGMLRLELISYLIANNNVEIQVLRIRIYVMSTAHHWVRSIAHLVFYLSDDWHWFPLQQEIKSKKCRLTYNILVTALKMELNQQNQQMTSMSSLFLWSQSVNDST